MKRRHLILLLGGASSGAMSVGTGAFSSVEAERGVEVNVVEDEEAYLGLEEGAGEGFVRIKNQFPADLDLTVTAALESGNGEVEVEKADGDLGIEIEAESDEDENDDESAPDNSADITIPLGSTADVTVECDGNGSLDLELAFSGEVLDNTGTTVDKMRTFSVECDEDAGESGGGGTSSGNVVDHVTKVNFVGNSGKVRILTTDNNGGANGTDGIVNAKLYCGDEGDVVSNEEFVGVEVDSDLSIDDFDADLEKPIAGVEIDGISGVFVNPNPGSGNTVNRSETESNPF